MSDDLATEYLRQAWAALLRGDTAERDRLCALSLKAHDDDVRLRSLKPTDSLGKH